MELSNDSTAIEPKNPRYTCVSLNKKKIQIQGNRKACRIIRKSSILLVNLCGYVTIIVVVPFPHVCNGGRCISIDKGFLANVYLYITNKHDRCLNVVSITLIIEKKYREYLKKWKNKPFPIKIIQNYTSKKKHKPRMIISDSTGNIFQHSKKSKIWSSAPILPNIPTDISSDSERRKTWPPNSDLQDSEISSDNYSVFFEPKVLKRSRLTPSVKRSVMDTLRNIRLSKKKSKKHIKEFE